MSNQECELGVWKATHDVRVRMGISAFTLPEGASVKVTQIDPMRGKPCRSGQGQERGRQSRPGGLDWF